MTTLSRERLTSALVEALEPQPWTDALWEGGSAAFGRLDEWSDLDLCLQVEPGRREDGLAAAREALLGLSPIEVEWRVPEPAWHGHSQCFWRLEAAGEFLVVDFAVLERGSTERFLETERHGRALALFDKGEWVRPEPLDRDSLRRRIAARADSLRRTWRLFRKLALKEARRGRSLEAAAFWQSHVLRPLVALLRMRHSPERHDFGFRQVHEDLPAAIVAELEALTWPAGPEALPALLERAEALFERTLAGLELD